MTNLRLTCDYPGSMFDIRDNLKCNKTALNYHIQLLMYKKHFHTSIVQFDLHSCCFTLRECFGMFFRDEAHLGGTYL